MRKSEIKKLKRLVYFSPLLGVTLGLIYFLIKSKFCLSFGFTKIDTLATVIASFSFTMLGFLAAMATFLFSLQKYRFFKRWLEDGDSEVFFAFFKITILCLFVTFASSVITFSLEAQTMAFRLMMMSLMNNIFQLIVITLVLVHKISSMSKDQ